MKKALIILSVIILSASAAFASYKDALKLFQEKKYSESLQLVTGLISPEKDFKPGSPNYKIRMLAAYANWKAGNSKAAIQNFNKCIEMNTGKADPYIGLCMILIDNRRYGDSDRVAKEGLNVENSAYLYYALGKSALKQMNNARAKDYFEKANVLNPEISYSYNGLGIALMNLKKYKEANTAFSIAYALREDSAEIINNYGLSFERLENFKEAAKYYGKASSFDSENKVIQENLARIKKKAD